MIILILFERTPGPKTVSKRAVHASRGRDSTKFPTNLGGLPKANTPREARSAQAKESRRQEKLFEQHAVVAIKKKDFPHTDSGRFRWSVIFPFITPYRSYDEGVRSVRPHHDPEKQRNESIVVCKD